MGIKEVEVAFHKPLSISYISDSYQQHSVSDHSYSYTFHSCIVTPGIGNMTSATKKPAPFYTTSNGRPITNPFSSERLGANGPVLLQDFHLIDLLAHFDRERIPERVVHAKGGGAFGEFEVTDDITDVVSKSSSSYAECCSNLCL
jgi:hypothetical protein